MAANAHAVFGPLTNSTDQILNWSIQTNATFGAPIDMLANDSGTVSEGQFQQISPNGVRVFLVSQGGSA